VNCNQTQTVEGEGGTLNLPQRKGAGQRTKLSVLNSQRTNTVTSHLQSRAAVECRADLLNQRAEFTIELPHFTGGVADQTATDEE
jgi:hypothetical protein